MKIKESLANGFKWLISTQNPDGSWVEDINTSLISTGLSLLSLELYALKNSISPFYNTYRYKDNVITALDYIFLNVNQSYKGVYFKNSNCINSISRICLATICTNGEPNKVVDVANSVIDGKTYKEVPQLIINYLTWSQDTNGGSGYSDCNTWINILKTGNLIQQMYFYGDDLSSTRLNKSITYIADN